MGSFRCGRYRAVLFRTDDDDNNDEEECSPLRKTLRGKRFFFICSKQAEAGRGVCELVRDVEIFPSFCIFLHVFDSER